MSPNGDRLRQRCEAVVDRVKPEMEAGHGKMKEGPIADARYIDRTNSTGQDVRG